MAVDLASVWVGPSVEFSLGVMYWQLMQRSVLWRQVVLLSFH